MGWISALFAHKVVRYVEGDAALRGKLLRSVGVEPEAHVDPEQMIRDTDFFGLLEEVVDEALSGPSIAVRIGASMRCDEYGAFGLAFKSAVDLASSYERVERYGRVVTSIANFRVVPGAHTTFLEVIPGSDHRLGLQLTHELALAAATSLSREVCQRDFSPVALHLAHDLPGDRTDIERHFQCPVHPRAGRDALEVSHELLRSPNRLGDSGISQFFDAHLDNSLTSLPDDGDLRRRVRAEIVQALSAGVPTLQHTARRLGMSGRTLQRRLAAAGLAYQGLLEDARRELSGRLLRESDYSLAEVAFLTGFSDQSTFSRAFKRWSGQTPRAYRLASQR